MTVVKVLRVPGTDTAVVGTFGTSARYGRQIDGTPLESRPGGSVRQRHSG
ncbi:hypothetical protein [Mycobacterium sp.]